MDLLEKEMTDKFELYQLLSEVFFVYVPQELKHEALAEAAFIIRSRMDNNELS